MSEDRLEEIRHTLEHEKEDYYYRYEEDVSYLLGRVEELDLKRSTLEASVGAQKKRNADLERRNRSHLERIRELEAENERLKRQLDLSLKASDAMGKMLGGR